MKFLKSLLLTAFIVSLGTMSQAQSVDEILDGYYELIGGKEAWNKVEGIKFVGKINQGGMEIPLEIVQTKSGESYSKASFQGMSFMQGVYDGETLWNTNFQTMKPEKVTSEDLENHKLSLNDFPDALINYKENNYTAEYIGTETFDGTDAYKIKLVKEQKTVDGAKQDDVEFYFFEVDSGAMIGQQQEITSGPMAGVISEVKYSDYEEHEGLYFPMTMTQGVKDGQSSPITVESIELNPEFDKEMLNFPEEGAEVEEEMDMEVAPPVKKKKADGKN